MLILWFGWNKDNYRDLGSSVDGQQRGGAQPGDGRYVDDEAPGAVLHLRHEEPRHHDHGRHVAVDEVHAALVAVRDVEQELGVRVGHADVVDEDPDLEAVQLLAQPLVDGRLREVDVDDLRLHSELRFWTHDEQKQFERLIPNRSNV